MKTLAVAFLLSIVSVVSAAGICFLVADSRSLTARQELAAFKEYVQEAVRKPQIFPASPQGGYIVSMAAPTISLADRAHIDSLQFKYESLIHQRDLAAWIFTRGAIVAMVSAGFCWLLRKQETHRALRPIPGN